MMLLLVVSIKGNDNFDNAICYVDSIDDFDIYAKPTYKCFEGTEFVKQGYVLIPDSPYWYINTNGIELHLTKNLKKDIFNQFVKKYSTSKSISLKEFLSNLDNLYYDYVGTEFSGVTQQPARHIFLLHFSYHSVQYEGMVLDERINGNDSAIVEIYKQGWIEERYYDGLSPREYINRKMNTSQ